MEISMSSKGQVVIPKYIRNKLDLKSGSRLLVSIMNNQIVLVPKPIDLGQGLVKAGEDITLRNIRREIKKE